MLVLLGDSHTRSYIRALHIRACIFLGPGKKNNFISIFSFASTTIRYLRAARKVKSLGVDFGFLIGEPDIRLEAYGGWHVPDGSATVYSTRNRTLPESWFRKELRRLNWFLFIMGVFNCKPKIIIGSGTPNAEIRHASLLLNRKLAALCANKKVFFFDPQQSASDRSMRVKDEYIGLSYYSDCQDHVHLSEKISDDLDRFLAKMLTDEEIASFDRCWQMSFHQNFTRVSKFGVYVPARSGIVQRLRVAIRRFLKTIGRDRL